ncbi:MAG TPA: hypothetical protein VGD69_26480 [Herpetosiphonaceae bacterium]
MSPGFLQLNGMTTIERHTMIERVKAALGESGAYILNFHMFSNAALVLQFEVPSDRVAQLGPALQATGLRLEQRSQELLAEWDSQIAARRAGEPRDIPGTLQITFIHNEPDLIIEVPMVPG